MARQGRSQADPGGGQHAPGDKSQQLIDAINNLAAAMMSLSQNVPQLCEMLDNVGNQFAVIIAVEAQKRNQSVEGFITQALMSLGNKAFRGGG